MSSPSSEIKSKAVRAGAGAGKTHNLTHQVLDFAIDFHSKNHKWPRVLVTTFTRKATQELSERLIKLAMEKKPESIEFATSSQYLSVSTIHGILDRFLKHSGHLIGFKSDFRYMKPIEASYLAKKILKDLAKNRDHYGPLFSAYSFGDLRSLLLESLEENLESYSPVNEEDLKKLLGEHLLRLHKDLQGVLKQTHGLKVNDKLANILNSLKSLEPLLNISSWINQRNTALQIIDSIDLKGLRVKADDEIYLAYEDIKELLKKLRKLEESRFNPEGFSHLAIVNKHFAKIRDDFKEQMALQKKVSSKIEISDLETYALEIVKKYPKEAKAFSADIDYWLIDEFQDTSPRQLDILKFLIDAKPYYLVGDPQQSIYLFRGARSEVFRDQVIEVEKTGGVLDFLDTNYRSQPHVLDFINALSKNLGTNFKAMKSAFNDRVQGPLAAQLTLIDGGDDISTQELVTIEMKNVLKQIVELKNQKVRLEEIAILVRKNDQLEKLGSFLNSHGIPVHLHSSGLFWERREIQDAVSLLKFLINPLDDVNLVKLLRAPFFSISDKELAEALSSRKGSVWPELRERFLSGEFGGTCQRLAQHLVSTKKLGVVVAFQRGLENLGFFDLHLKYDPSGRAEGNLWKFVYLLKNFETERGANFIKFVNDAEKPERMDRTVDAPGSVEPNKINIMTVHAAKGLQFDYVFLPFLDLTPYNPRTERFAIDDQEKKWCVRAPASEEEHKSSSSLFELKVIDAFKARQDEEDLRVFYVAYTRAKSRLFLSWSLPVKESSWAHYLKSFVRPDGIYQEEGFSFSVTRLSQAPALEIVGLDEKSISVPQLFTGTREQSWGHVTSDGKSVTRLLEAKSQAIINYKNSFIKKTEGILFHKILEIIKYPNQKDLVSLVGDWFPGREEEIGQALNYTLSMTEPPLVELIKRGHVEWSFRTRKSEKEIEGQIDLWGVIDGHLWLVDYKSGEKILKEKAFEQLKLYASAVRDYLGWHDKISLAVVYPMLEESFVKTIEQKDLIF